LGHQRSEPAFHHHHQQSPVLGPVAGAGRHNRLQRAAGRTHPHQRSSPLVRRQMHPGRRLPPPSVQSSSSQGAAYHTNRSLGRAQSPQLAASNTGRQQVHPLGRLRSAPTPLTPGSRPAPTNCRQAAAVSHNPHLLGSRVAILLALETSKHNRLAWAAMARSPDGLMPAQQQQSSVIRGVWGATQRRKS
jgi:hypothetical protein